MKLVIGLGNPGKEYAVTRHNVGYMIVDVLARELGADGWKHDESFEADIVEVVTSAPPTLRESLRQPADNTPGVVQSPDQEKLMLVKPTTFMNNSGRAVERIRAYYKLKLADLIVVHDELDLLLGTVRVRLGGQTAGHNGIGSLIHHLGTEQFWRVRIGIGSDHPERHADTTGFVLKAFLAEERATVDTVVDRVGDWLVQSLTSGTLEEQTITVT